MAVCAEVAYATYLITPRGCSFDSTTNGYMAETGSMAPPVIENGEVSYWSDVDAGDACIFVTAHLTPVSCRNDPRSNVCKQTWHHQVP